MAFNLLKTQEVYFYYPDKERKNYHRMELKNGMLKDLYNNHWKEVKVFNDGFTDLIMTCELLVGIGED